MSAITLEQRVAALEFELRELKGQFQSLSSRKPNSNWFNQVAGSMADFPDFAEVRRYMQESREGELADIDARPE